MTLSKKSDNTFQKMGKSPEPRRPGFVEQQPLPINKKLPIPPMTRYETPGLKKIGPGKR